MRERVAWILLFLSWPVCLVHRIWNNAGGRDVRWIVADRSVCQDFRWYYVYNELWLSSTLVLISFLIAKRKTRHMQHTLIALLIVSGLDLVNYWLWFRRNEGMLWAEGAAMLICNLLNVKRREKTY